MYVCTYFHVHMYGMLREICACIYIYMCVYIYNMYICIHKYTYKQYTNTKIYMNPNTYIHTESRNLHVHVQIGNR